MRSLGWALLQYDWCLSKRIQTCPEGRSREGIVLRYHLQHKERVLRRNQPLNILILTSGLQNCEKVNFCYLSHSIWGTLLWQPQQMNSERNRGNNYSVNKETYLKKQTTTNQKILVCKSKGFKVKLMKKLRWDQEIFMNFKKFL